MKILENKKLLVVDIKLKDNRGCLNNCLVFSSDEKGADNTQDKNLIKQLLNGEIKEFVTIQNKRINVLINVCNIESWILKEINDEDF